MMDWLIALALGALPFLFLLACPIVMLLMMRMSMGGHRVEHMAEPSRQDVGKLQASERIDLLELQQDELARQIATARQELTEPASPVAERTR